MIGLIWRGLALLALLAGIYALERHIEQRGYDRARNDCATSLALLQASAATSLAEQTAKTLSAEQALRVANNKQDLQDATHQKTIMDLSDRLRRAAGPAGRLRDPNTSQCGGSGHSPPGDAATATAAGPADRAQAGGLLSEPLTELLQRLARDAEDINAAYASCRADAFTLRGGH